MAEGLTEKTLALIERDIPPSREADVRRLIAEIRRQRAALERAERVAAAAKVVGNAASRDELFEACVALANILGGVTTGPSVKDGDVALSSARYDHLYRVEASATSALGFLADLRRNWGEITPPVFPGTTPPWVEMRARLEREIDRLQVLWADTGPGAAEEGQDAD